MGSRMYLCAGSKRLRQESCGNKENQSKRSRNLSELGVRVSVCGYETFLSLQCKKDGLPAEDTRSRLPKGGAKAACRTKRDYEPNSCTRDFGIDRKSTRLNSSH